MTEITVHAFEKAGLGKAPFRCVGMASIPSTGLLEANPDAYNNAMKMLPNDVGCGTCDFCGTAIMHNFIIKGSGEGDRRFVVGSDCVARTGDAGLVKLVRAERLKIVREKREASRAMKRAEREALWATERAARASAFAIEYAGLITAAAPFMETDRFIKDVMERHLGGSFVSWRALAAVEQAIINNLKRAERKANSRHVGKVGERLELAVTVVRRSSFDRPCYGAEWRNETVWVVSMTDQDGNTIVSKSTAFYAEKGEAFRIKATVKDHNEYEGERQTLVQRIKKLT